MIRWVIGIALCVFAFLIPALARADATRLTVQELNPDEHGFTGALYAAEEHSARVGVIVFGGSEGGIPAHHARAIAREGYPTLAVAYFGTPGLPTHLDLIPLEPSLTAIGWMHEHVLNGEGKVVLLGGAKGAELALLLGSMEPRVAGVIAYSPSHVVFQGIPENFWPPQSSWTHEGEPLAYVPYKYGPHFNPFAEEPDLLALYRESLTQERFVERAAIAVEQINGPVLLFSGREDRLWPASEMADAMIRRLDAHDHPHPFEHHAYEAAGHVISPEAGEWSEQLGGTAEANRAAGRDAMQRVLQLLARLEEDGAGEK